MVKKVTTAFLLLVLFNGCSANEVETVEKKNINDVDIVENNYYLFYPADSRTTQDYTSVKELDKKGNSIKNYKITQSTFGRVTSFQNPLYPDIVYLRKFGEPTLETSYYEYHLKDHSFSPKSFEYFDYEVGINNFFTFGKDTMLTTVVSHKTGEQNTTEDGQFQMSISNTETQKSVELPFNSVPMITVNLDFKDKGIYMTSGYLADAETGQVDNKGIGVVDFDTESVKFLNPEDKNGMQYWPVYSDENYFYVFSDLGTLFKYDENFNFERSFPLKDFENTYFVDELKPLYSAGSKILYSFYEGEQQIVGLLSIEDNTFTEIDLEGHTNIKILYHDMDKAEIYLTSDDGNSEETGQLIILDSKNLTIKKEIQINDPWTLDFVIHG